MGDPQCDILNPRSIVLPDATGVDMSTAEKGSIFISSGAVWFAAAVGTLETV